MMALSMRLFCLFIATVLAEISSSPPKDLPDRGVEPVPNCRDDFDEIEKQQIAQGFRYAQDLAAAAYEASSDDNPIYMRYFPTVVTCAFATVDPAEVAREVFKRVWAGQLDGYGKTLRKFLFSKYFDTIKYGYVCTDPSYAAEIIGAKTTDPTIILCDNAFRHGAISRQPRGFPDAVNCDTVGTQTSWRMSTLGSTLLHEWTHIDALVGDAFHSDHRFKEGTGDYLEETGDRVYGGVDTQAVPDQDGALYVAENYVWFATEAYWSKQCKRSFQNPGSESDKDPLFSGQAGGTSFVPLIGSIRMAKFSRDMILYIPTWSYRRPGSSNAAGNRWHVLPL